MSIPFLDIIGGVTDVSGQLLEFYKVRRDGSFFQQQEFLHELSQKQAASQEIRNAKREELVASMAESKAQADYARSVQLTGIQAELSVLQQERLKADDRALQNSPFAYQADEVYDIAYQATGGGRKPVLLIAPFFNDEQSRKDADDGPPTFRVAVRRGWVGRQWSADAAIMDGLIDRPLRNTDLDLLLVQSTLRDLPVILVHGHLQRGRRAWCSVVAWNIGGRDERSQMISINLPPMQLPEREVEASSESLDFEDRLAATVSLTAALLAQWFHLISYGRHPLLHRYVDSAETDNSEIGGSLAAAYDVAMTQGVVDNYVGKAKQAEILFECGLDKAAARVASLVLHELVAGDLAEMKIDLDTVIKLREIAASEAQEEEVLDDLLEKLNRAFVFDFLGLRK